MPAQIYREQERRKTEVSEVKPTLLIGLGGTGKEVLLRLRQRFFEKYSLVGFPTMAYLWIDTDIQNQNIDGRPLDYIDQQARFQEGEWVDAQVLNNDFQAIFANPNQNRYIFRWIYPSLAVQGSVINGSRQIRPLGRLGFFRAYSTIRRRLSALRNQVMSQQARLEMQGRYGIQVDPSNVLQVILVCSLAGGTGSGMFLDTAFLLRQMFADTNPDIVGYLVLPPVFAPAAQDGEPIYANAYAALKELEFYSMRKDLLRGEARQQGEDGSRFTSAHDFEVDWENTSRPLTIPGPPFNTCYLINNQTLGGGSIGPTHKTHLCDMIAENIFMDFHTQSFSDKKRSVRSNLDDYLTGELEYRYLDVQGQPLHSEIFSCRFSTMGFTMLYVPTDRIRKACAYQLGLELLDRWLADHEVSGMLEDDMRRHVLPQLALRASREADDFRAALERVDDAGQTFWPAIAARWSEQEKRQLLNRVRSPSPNLRPEIERRRLSYAQEMLDKPQDRTRWGAFVQRLELVNRPAFLAAAQRHILTVLRTWLKSDHIRLAAAQKYLSTLHTILDRHHDAFTRIRDRAVQEAERLRSDIRVLENVIDDEEHGLWVHRWSLRVLVEDICEKIRQYFENHLRSLLFGTAAELCQELQRFIGSQVTEKLADGSEVIVRAGLLHEIWNLTEALRNMRNDFQGKITAFERSGEHLIFENLYTPGMFKEYYKFQRADGVKVPVDLGQMEQLYYAEIGIDGPYDLIAQAEQVGIANVHSLLEAFCLARFTHLEIDVDAVHTFYARYPEASNRRRVLDRFVRNGTVWLQPSQRARVEQNIIARYADDAEIGMYQDGMQHSNYRETYETIRQLVQAANFRSQINPAVDVHKDAVYLYSEIAGIPLVYIDNIEAYKRVYNKLAGDGRELHIDKRSEQFTDIVIQDSMEIAETIRINRVLFVGAILRVVELSSHEGRPIQYNYLDRGGLSPRRQPLGNQAMAVETLRANPSLLERIEREVSVVRSTLSTLARQKFLATLMYHTMDGSIPGTSRGPYPPTYIAVGGVQIEKFSPECRAIEEVIREEQRILEREMVADQEQIRTKMVELYAHLDEFSDAVPFGERMHRVLQAHVVSNTSQAAQGMRRS